MSGIVEFHSSDTVDLYYSAVWQLIEERESGLAVVSYVSSPVYVDAMISRDRDTDANGSLDERLYVLHDANFNVTGLVTTGGSVVERFTYEPFGKVEIRDASWSIKSGGTGYSWLYLHQGGRFDSTSGLYAFRMREYSPTLGRWMTNDPIGYLGRSLVYYQYVNSNPVKNLDSSGLISVDELPKNPPLPNGLDEHWDSLVEFLKTLDRVGFETPSIAKAKLFGSKLTMCRAAKVEVGLLEMSIGISGSGLGILQGVTNEFAKSELMKTITASFPRYYNDIECDCGRKCRNWKRAENSNYIFLKGKSIVRTITTAVPDKIDAKIVEVDSDAGLIDIYLESLLKIAGFTKAVFNSNFAISVKISRIKGECS